MPQLISVDLVAAAKLSTEVPQGYRDEDLRAAESQYKKFLTLAAKNRGQCLVPTKEIDMMWHLHMLHPRAYYNDCMDLFGDILDHNGGYGLSDGEAEGFAVASDKTIELWEQEFSESYLSDMASCRADKAPDAASCMADGETLSEGKQLVSCGSPSKGKQLASCGSPSKGKQLASCGSPSKGKQLASCMADGLPLVADKQPASCMSGKTNRDSFPAFAQA